jgi:arsenate reductase (thioredoxin)
MSGEKKKVLFLCTHNSARSQMAEGILRSAYGDKYEASSAGTEPSRVNPYAVRAMAEIGIDISGHGSKSVEKFEGEKFDTVVTVCDHAKDVCPAFPGAKKYLHRGFTDPSRFRGKDEEILEGFREVRDEIKSWIDNEFKSS